MQSVLRNANDIFADSKSENSMIVNTKGISILSGKELEDKLNAFNDEHRGGITPSQSESIEQSDTQIIAKKEEIIAEKTLPNITPDMLPDAISGWVKDVCERIESPFEIGAVTALTLIGNLIGNRVGIRPKQKDSWTVVPNLWGMIIGKPSIKKTPVYNELYKAVSRLEAEANESYKAEMEAYLLEEELYKAKKKEAVKKDDDTSKIKELTQPTKPSKKRYATSDGTIEAIADIISYNPNGLLVTRDELSGFLKMMDKAGKEGDRAFYLEGWNGTSSFSVDRIMRGSTYIPRLTLGVLGNIQPSMVKQYVYEAVQGHKADGFLQRFQLTVFAQAIEQKGVDRYPDKEARDRFYNVVETIAKTEFFSGSKQDDFENIPYYNFKDDAQKIFNEWFLSNDKEAKNAFNEAYEGHLSKYPQLFTSLALIFNVCEAATIKEGKYSYDISKENTLKALRLVEVLKAHAERLYSTYEVEEAKRDERADKILSFIGSNALPLKFRDVTQGTSGKPNKAEIINAIKGVYRAAGSEIISKI